MRKEDQRRKVDPLLKSNPSLHKMLNIREPSVIQMLKKLKGQDLIVYNKNGIKLTESGQKILQVGLELNEYLQTVNLNKKRKIDSNVSFYF